MEIEGLEGGDSWEQNTSFYFVTSPNPFKCWSVKPRLTEVGDMG